MASIPSSWWGPRHVALMALRAMETHTAGLLTLGAFASDETYSFAAVPTQVATNADPYAIPDDGGYLFALPVDGDPPVVPFLGIDDYTATSYDAFDQLGKFVAVELVIRSRVMISSTDDDPKLARYRSILTSEALCHAGLIAIGENIGMIAAGEHAEAFGIVGATDITDLPRFETTGDLDGDGQTVFDSVGRIEVRQRVYNPLSGA